MRQYVVSNGTIAAQTKKLERSGLAELMDGVFLSEEPGVDKPDIGFFEKVFSAIHADDLSKVMIVGDSLTSDIQGGMNARIKTCRYDPGRKPIPENYRADHCISDLHELIDLPDGETGTLTDRSGFESEEFMTEEKNKARAARRGDWKTESMPDKHETFVLNRSFSDEQMEALRRGNIPQAMEDKWFWYMESSTLWAHRSWTGCCIYRIDFKEDNNHIVTVNRDPEQYRCTDIEEDAESLNRLLDLWTQTPYDHYNEWLSETYCALKKAGKQ